MGGSSLEIFKVQPKALKSSIQFGMYIMFPIGWMYYFGTNLENRFAVPDFWPAPEQTHKIPFERDELKAELERLRTRRLQARARRLQEEQGQGREEKDG
ncbi:MAG: hypothetical protein Q9213_000137 [Squamulea squamosa]